MTRRSAVARWLAPAAGLAMAAAAGCSLIVPGDVPEFRCTGAAPSSCPSGMTCDTTTSKCVLDAGAPPGEDGGDEDGGSDARNDARDADATGPLDLGTACRVNEDCKSKLCGTSTILTTTITQGPGPICTTPCCSSGECSPGFVCFNGGTGGGYCVPAQLAQRTLPASGGKSPGTTCTKNDECRSGLCTGSPLRCLDTCCVQSECAAGTVCRLKSVSAPGPAHDIWVCAPAEPGATGAPGADCVSGGNLACTTDNCIGIGVSRICRPPCSNTASCRTVAGFENGHCLYGSSGSDYFKFCFSGTTLSDSDAGAACTDDTTCESDYCDAELKKCANVCGKDSDCAANEACRPSGVNTPYLRCVAK